MTQNSILLARAAAPGRHALVQSLLRGDGARADVTIDLRALDGEVPTRLDDARRQVVVLPLEAIDPLCETPFARALRDLVDALETAAPANLSLAIARSDEPPALLEVIARAAAREGFCVDYAPAAARASFGARLLSRLIDFGFALGVLVTAGWLMLLLAVAIRLDSPGPAFFRQLRVGREGRHFTVWKFRTMAVGTAQAGTHEVAASAVTRIGAFLRRTKLDELPQVFNILRGELALVGPRPCLPVQAELVEARRARGVYGVLPGITGLAQVFEIDMSRPQLLARWDQRYAALASPAYDLKLFLMTLLGRGQGDRMVHDAVRTAPDMNGQES